MKFTPAFRRAFNKVSFLGDPELISDTRNPVRPSIRYSLIEDISGSLSWLFDNSVFSFPIIPAPINPKEEFLRKFLRLCLEFFIFSLFLLKLQGFKIPVDLNFKSIGPECQSFVPSIISIPHPTVYTRIRQNFLPLKPC